MFTDESGEGIIGILIACFIISGVILGAIDGGLNSTNTGWGLVGDILIGGVKGGLIAAAWALSFAGGAMVGAGLGSVGGALALAGGGIMGGGAVAGMATAIAGVGVIVVGGTIAQQLHILLSIDMHGKPNSTVVSGGSTGKYDENGNLVSRQDTTGKAHFIKELNGYYLPHTHTYEWKLINGIWRIVKKLILPW